MQSRTTQGIETQVKKAEVQSRRLSAGHGLLRGVHGAGKGIYAVNQFRRN